MPDLSIENRYACSNFEYFQTIINRHNVSYDNGNWYCDCKSFQFRKRCKHIEQAKTMKCSWNSEYDDESPIVVYKTDNNTLGLCCPKCGENIIVFKIAV